MVGVGDAGRRCLLVELLVSSCPQGRPHRTAALHTATAPPRTGRSPSPLAHVRLDLPVPRTTRRAVLLSPLLATSLLAGAFAALPAQAVSGPAAAGKDLIFTARLDVGGGARACSGVLVESRWVLTSAGCFTDDAATPSPGKPPRATTVTIGRTDLTTSGGEVRKVVGLVPRADRDVVLAELDKAVTTVAPVSLATAAPAAGSRVTVAGYGRTKDEWSPLKMHTGAFTLGTASEATLAMTGKDGAAVCGGDIGGPVLATKDGKTELIALNSRSWQGGCFGSDPAEARTGALGSRVDDIRDWVSAHVARWGLKSEANGKYVAAEFNDAGNLRGRLRARSATPSGTWEQFTLHANGTSGAVSLRSTYENLYVSAEVKDSGSHAMMLRARSAGAGGWERFALERQPNGSYALKSLQNGKYVAAEVRDRGADNGLLRARSGSVGGWERFSFKRADNFATARRDEAPAPLPAG